MKSPSKILMYDSLNESIERSHKKSCKKRDFHLHQIYAFDPLKGNEKNDLNLYLKDHYIMAITNNFAFSSVAF